MFVLLTALYLGQDTCNEYNLTDNNDDSSAERRRKRDEESLFALCGLGPSMDHLALSLELKGWVLPPPPSGLRTTKLSPKRRAAASRSLGKEA